MSGVERKPKKKFSFERKNFVIAIMVIIFILLIAFAFVSRDSFVTNNRPERYTEYEVYKMKI